MTRRSIHAIEPVFIERWSRRAFSDRPIDKTTLETLFEAARWAPSSFNAQPWEYHVTLDPARRAAWNEAVGPHNRPWADNAPVLVWVVAKTTLRDGRPNRHAWFDTGAATMQLVLQAHHLGLTIHAMGGINTQAAHEHLGLTETQDVVCALAIGYPGDPSRLPDALRTREQPNGRTPQEDFVRWL